MARCNKLGGAGDWFGDYLCVNWANLPCLSGRNQFTNTKFPRPITKISKSNYDARSPIPLHPVAVTRKKTNKDDLFNVNVDAPEDEMQQERRLVSGLRKWS